MKRLELLRTKPELKDNLWKIVDAIQSGLRDKGYNLGTTKSPVTPVFLNGTEYEAGNLILELREKYNVFCSMVIYPIVPKNIIMLRIIPTAVHSLEDVKITIDAFDAVRKNLESGVYRKEGIFNFEQ
jgi:glycine C-acetyltransferase